MIVSVLGIIDIIAGVMLSVGGLSYFHGNGLVLTFAAIMLIKGVWSWLTNLAMPTGIKIDPMGILDIISALLLFLVFSGFFLYFFAYLGIILIIKGIYSFVVGVIK